MLISMFEISNYFQKGKGNLISVVITIIIVLLMLAFLVMCLISYIKHFNSQVINKNCYTHEFYNDIKE